MFACVLACTCCTSALHQMEETRSPAQVRRACIEIACIPPPFPLKPGVRLIFLNIRKRLRRPLHVSAWICLCLPHCLSLRLSHCLLHCLPPCLSLSASHTASLTASAFPSLLPRTFHRSWLQPSQYLPAWWPMLCTELGSRALLGRTCRSMVTSEERRNTEWMHHSIRARHILGQAAVLTLSHAAWFISHDLASRT